MPIIRDRVGSDTSTDRRNVEAYNDFLIAAELLQQPRLARIYVYTCYAGTTTIDTIIDALGLKRATTYEDIEELETIGAIDRDDSTRPHEIDADAFAFVDQDGIAITPTVFHAISVTEIDGDVDYVYNRYGPGTVAAAVRLTAQHYAGQLTKRMVASELGIKPVEGISLVTALERVIALGIRFDPYFEFAVGDISDEISTSVDASLAHTRNETVGDNE